MPENSARSLEVVASGFAMAEGPRWVGDAVVLTDIHDDAIKSVDGNGTVSTLLELESPPISVGFLRDGTMLVSSLASARIWSILHDGVAVFADLAGLSEFDWGDVVVDAHDRVYIANQGISYPRNVPDSIDSRIYLVQVGQPVSEVARSFLYANGLAITDDEQHMVVAESFGHRLWRLPIYDDGTLGERELLVQLDEMDRPDGICCDADGGVWSANATGRAVVRVGRDGAVTDRISTGDDLAIGCILGGPNGKDLYVTTAPTADRQLARDMRASTLWRVAVDIPAGGRP